MKNLPITTPPTATPDDIDAARAAAVEFAAILDTIADSWLAACTAGLSQEDAFATMRESFASLLGVSRLQAANYARLVIAAAGRKVGEYPYDRRQLSIILDRCAGKSIN